MKSWSIPAGKILGVEIRLHLAFLALLAFVWMSESTMRGGPTSQPTAMRGVALVAIILVSVIAHEVGHLWVAVRNRVRPKVLILLPTGGIPIFEDGEPPQAGKAKRTFRSELWPALAGPLVNLGVALIAGLLIGFYAPQAQLFTKPFAHSNHLLRSVVWVNVFLGLFNLLPAYPLDGGHLLRAYFAKTIDPAQATRRAVSIAHAQATLLIVLGMLLFMEGGNPDSWWIMAAGFFLLIGAQFEERSAIFHSVMETVHLEDVMLTDFATLSPADTLEDALEKAVHTLQDDFPVVRGGDMVGVISKANILEALRIEGNGYVQAAMNRIFEVASRQESLASAFRKLNSRNLSIIPVVEDQKLVGIITLQNLMHSMALLAESRKLRRQALES
jgi:Zn-dependent protease/CBS domain-containing protein